MTEQGKPRAAAYQRISEIAWAGDDHGVRNQLSDQRKAAQARGYEIVLEKHDNDISALSGRHRPGYEAVMDAAEAGEIDVILVFQLSRFWRNRVERAQGIEILRKAGISVIATRGPSLDMTTAYGRAMAGLLGEFDTMESEVKGERQQLANRAAAVAGRARKGTPRPFGWQADRITADPAEAAAVLDGCRAILAGETLLSIAREWDRRGLRPHQVPYGPLRKNAWTRTSVKEILANPRVAGISVYLGKEVATGEWEPLVPEEMWRAAAEIIRTPRFNCWAPRGASLLGGIAFCRCGNYVTGGRSANGLPAYRCNLETRDYRPGPHVNLKRDGPDAAIAAAVIDRLSRPDAVHLLTPQAEGDVTALRDEELILRARLATLGQLFMDGKISDADLTGGRARGEERLAQIAAELADLGRESVLAPIVMAEDPASIWEGLTLERKRAVVGALMTVTLYPSGSGARRFDPGKVLPPGKGIVWKQG